MFSKFLTATALILAINACWREEIATEVELKKAQLFKSFQEWQIEYKVAYNSIEQESLAYLQWLDNLEYIKRENAKNLPYKLRINQFGAMSSEEFRMAVHGHDGACFKKSELLNSIKIKEAESSDESSDEPVNAPASVDWRTKGVVTPVKNQGQCGSCWAFSATGALECDYAIKTGKLNSLSEQELVDCAGRQYGCDGCNGGQMSGALEYASKNGGLCSENEYPYTARDGTCKSNCGTKYDANSGYTPVSRDSEPAMLNAAAEGCVSIGIEADQTAFQHYSSGVLTGNCGTRIDHGVLIVGYGVESGTDYWLVKNSWGKTWGEQGYVKICRNCNKNGNEGECGILTEGNVPQFR